MSQCLISQDLQSSGEENGTGNMHSFVLQEQRELKLTTVRLARRKCNPTFPVPAKPAGASSCRHPGSSCHEPSMDHRAENAGIVIKWGRSLRFKPGPPELNEYWSQEEEQESNHTRSSPSCGDGPGGRGGGRGRPWGSGHSTGCTGRPIPALGRG